MRPLPVFGVCVVLSSLAWAQEPAQSFAGVVADQSLGRSVSLGADVDGDGFGDLAIGSDNDAGGAFLGQVDLYSGRDGSLIRTVLGLAPFGCFGAAVELADLDGDGRAELIAGAPFDGPNGEGAVHVFSGSSGAWLRSAFGDRPNDELGAYVVVLGDVDRDGTPDYAAGISGLDLPVTNGGGVRVYSGRTGAVLYTATGAVPDGELGKPLRPVRDLDGDGIPDFLAGGTTGLPNLLPRVEVRSGATGALVRVHTTLSAGFDGIGDVDGDGRADYVLGEPDVRDSNQQLVGAVNVHSGRTGNRIARALGQPGRPIGGNVGGVGDANGDLRPDFACSTAAGNSFDLRYYDGGTASLLGVHSTPFRAEVITGAHLRGTRATEVLIGNEFERPAGGPALAGRAALYSPGDRLFSILPSTVVAPGQSTFLVRGCPASQPVGVFVTAVNGVPNVFLWLIGSSDPQGTYTLNLPIPQGVAGAVEFLVVTLGAPFPNLTFSSAETLVVR